MKVKPKKFKKSVVLLTTHDAFKKALESPKELPKISREITERWFRVPGFDSIYIVSFICGMLLTVIGLCAWRVQIDSARLTQAKAKRDAVEKELTYWQKVTTSYPTYRDAYYQAAVSALQLGNTDVARGYVMQALAIDPTFADGKTLLEKINRN